MRDLESSSSQKELWRGDQIAIQLTERRAGHQEHDERIDLEPAPQQAGQRRLIETRMTGKGRNAPYRGRLEG